jgi:hypothetical protein
MSIIYIDSVHYLSMPVCYPFALIIFLLRDRKASRRQEMKRVTKFVEKIIEINLCFGNMALFRYFRTLFYPHHHQENHTVGST